MFLHMFFQLKVSYLIKLHLNTMLFLFEILLQYVRDRHALMVFNIY